MLAPTTAPAPGGHEIPGDPVQAEALTNELSHDLMSPYCPGRTIATCPSPQARKLENHIHEQALQGKSRVEIESALAERFPDIRGYVGRPEIIYGTALLALLAIVGLIVVGRRWVRQTRVPVAADGAAGVGLPLAVMNPDLPPTPTVAGKPSRNEVDALDDALDRIDEF
jgi:cytochrome c-type biogenesis protein CcmH/NrfF